MVNEIQRLTRNNIFDVIRLKTIDFSGRMNDLEFLRRLYDLDQLPSHDSRYRSAASDIWQHTVNNDDYESDRSFAANTHSFSKTQ